MPGTGIAGHRPHGLRLTAAGAKAHGAAAELLNSVLDGEAYGGSNRPIARLAFDDLPPQTVLNRRSKGTFVSYSGTVYRRRKQEMTHLLLGGELQTRGLLDADALLSLFDSETTPQMQ